MGFIHETLIGFNFPQIFFNLVMNCITTPSFWFYGMVKLPLLSCPLEQFINQQDPLSPYIFVLYLERLSILDKDWTPYLPIFLSLSPYNNLSHLFYANDVFLLGKAY